MTTKTEPTEEELRKLVPSLKELKQLWHQRRLNFGKYEIRIEDGQPIRMVDIKESIKL